MYEWISDNNSTLVWNDFSFNRVFKLILTIVNDKITIGEYKGVFLHKRYMIKELKYSQHSQ